MAVYKLTYYVRFPRVAGDFFDSRVFPAKNDESARKKTKKFLKRESNFKLGKLTLKLKPRGIKLVRGEIRRVVEFSDDNSVELRPRG